MIKQFFWGWVVQKGGFINIGLKSIQFHLFEGVNVAKGQLQVFDLIQNIFCLNAEDHILQNEVNPNDQHQKNAQACYTNLAGPSLLLQPLVDRSLLFS